MSCLVTLTALVLYNSVIVMDTYAIQVTLQYIVYIHSLHNTSMPKCYAFVLNADVLNDPWVCFQEYL